MPGGATYDRGDGAETQATVATFRGSLRLLLTRRFGTFWFASLLSSIGTWAQQVAEPWLLLGLGASPFVVGLDSFASNAPVWLLIVFGGALADHGDRRRVIAVFQSVQMLCPTLIVAMLLGGGIAPWVIVALSVVVGVTDALSMPSFQSIVPMLVPREQIGRGLALNSIQFSLSRILGPAIAGVLLAGAGAVACFAISAASYVPLIAVALWILPRGRPGPPRARGETRVRKPFGVGQILRVAELRATLLTVFATGLLCAPIVTFTPVLVRDVFGGGATHFAVAVASFGVGGLVGAAVLLGVPDAVERRRLSVGFALVVGVSLVASSLMPTFWGLPPLLVLGGASMTLSNTASNSILQTTARPELLGQTVSLFMLALRGGISLGALLTGATVGLLGVQRALMLNGVLAIAAQLAIAVTSWTRRAEATPPAA